MHSYYPFLAHEVSKLEENTAGSRERMYQEAREDLVAKLRRPALRLPESEIAGELRAFEAAIGRIEEELVRSQRVDSGPAGPMTPISREASDSTASASITRIESESLGITEVMSQSTHIIPTEESKSVSTESSISTGDLYRQRAAALRAIGTPRALELAARHERLAVAADDEQTYDKLPQTYHSPSTSIERLIELDVMGFRMTHAPDTGSLPRDAVTYPGSKASRWAAVTMCIHRIVVFIQHLLKQFVRMIATIVACSLVFVLIYLAASIQKWLGFN
jgi:hypothetical protein